MERENILPTDYLYTYIYIYRRLLSGCDALMWMAFLFLGLHSLVENKATQSNRAVQQNALAKQCAFKQFVADMPLGFSFS